MKKNKVSIVTMHKVFNYGSVLQTYATQKVFEKEGFEVEVVDYITEARTLKKQFKEVSPKIKNSIIHKGVYYFFKLFSFYLKKITFWGFLKKNVNLTKETYVSYSDLQKNPPKADIYVTGSDQVWNSKYNCGIDKGFYLDFVDSSEKYAFASSFGMNSIPENEKQEVKKMLEKYKRITVREDEAVSILNDLEIKNSQVIIDPTLQLLKEEWEAISSPRLVKEKYVLLMLLYNEDNNATNYARQIADKLGIKLVKISWEMKKDKGIDILFTHRPPKDFLSLFNNAEFIVTNSFHGLAFSINLNKEFIVVRRNEFNSRIDSLLRLTKLEDRLFDKEHFSIDVLNNKIDYNLVENILNNEREKAQKYIKEISENYEKN